MAKRKKRQQRRQNRKSSRPDNAKPVKGIASDWDRSGAHNIAGVSFQVWVTARLLIDGLTGKLPLARVTPEGFEDIDLEFDDGSRTLVQVKERSPKFRFGRSELINALRDKRSSLAEQPEIRFALATNADLSRGLAVTGWSQQLGDRLSEEELTELGARLAPHFSEPHEIIRRTHVVRTAENVAASCRSDLASHLDVAPSVATLAMARLVETITEIAVRQRNATPGSSEWISPSDVDALATRIRETVDVQSLDEAIRGGIVEPVDFGVRSGLSLEDFLAGVDVLPSHIAADLDILRPTEIDVISAALGKSRSALLTGPSGSGKSALMWRTARELAGRTRPYRLLRLRIGDLATLSRWIRLQEPSEHSPLLLCADNLGRPNTEAWPELAREFADQPGVLLFGACREEDFRPDLVVGQTVIVDPKLDHGLAISVARALAERGVHSNVDVDEAFDESDCLLMEFLSMLLTGRRLKQVVGQQVADRFGEERATERAILRYVTTAHAAGVSVPAEALQAFLPDKDLTLPLSVLNREHLIVADGQSRWRGLHELRSEAARDSIHSLPPPTLAVTIRDLVTHLPVGDAGRVIEFYGRAGIDLMPAVTAVSKRLNLGDINAADSTRLMDNLAMADAFRHAHECLSVVDGLRPEHMDPQAAVMLAYGHRFAGVDFGAAQNALPGYQHVVELADALPPRPESLRTEALENLSERTVQDIALRGNLAETATWLESLEGSVVLSAPSIDEIWGRFANAQLGAKSRAVATLIALSCPENTDRFCTNLGSLECRTRLLANYVPDCVDFDTGIDPDGQRVTLRLLAPEIDDLEESLLNDRSVQTCRLIFDLCPEANIAEVIVDIPGGGEYKIGNHQPGRKRIPRENLPRSTATHGNSNFRRAVRMLLASRYWTEPLRELVESSKQLSDLRNDACAWLLNQHHNSRRRRQNADLSRASVARLVSGNKEPLSDDGSVDPIHTREALNEAFSVIHELAANIAPSDAQRRALAARCMSLVGRFQEARQGNLPRLTNVGDPLPDSLDSMFSLLAQVLWAQADRRIIPFVATQRRRSESWVDVAQKLVNAAAIDGYMTEMRALETATWSFDGIVGIQRIELADGNVGGFLAERWVVLIDAESDDPELLGFINRLDRKLVQLLAFRLFVVFSMEGRMLPLNGLQLGLEKWWPVDEKQLSDIASKLDMEMMGSVNLIALDEFNVILTNASRSAALIASRRQADLEWSKRPFDLLFDSAKGAANRCHPTLRPQANRLLDRVESEPDNGAPTFAREFFQTITDDKISDDMAALIKLRIAALSVDL